MRIPIALLAVLVAAAPAGAISRYHTANMSCGEARDIVRSEGAVILRFRATYANVPRYGRFVASNYFCSSGEIAETTWIPTADTNSCPLLECHIYDLDDDPFFRLRRH